MMIRLDINKIATHYDVIIIGGGITGCAMAYEASARGLKVLLLEKNDFGSATSFATSKLIHGGLRYLKNFEFDLVRESLEERKILGNITPNLVKPLRFLIPQFGSEFINNILIKSGLYLYDLLSYDKQDVKLDENKLQNHETISIEEILKEEPNIKKDDLIGAIAYYDYQNLNPNRMTMSFLLSAVEKGATVLNYKEVKDFIRNKDQSIGGVEVYDKVSQNTFQFFSKIVINCSGPWSDELLSLVSENSVQESITTRSEGIHLITKSLVYKNTYTCETEEGDHLLIMPWRGHSIIGTNDREYKGNPSNYTVQKESIDEILFKANKYFCSKDEPLTYKDILFVYGGLRPLAKQSKKDSYNTSRKYEIFDEDDLGIKGLITVTGGKYTTSRNLAENTIDLLEDKNFILKDFDTKKQQLVGCRIDEVSLTIKELKKVFPNLFLEETYLYYATLYGELSFKILELAKNNASLRNLVSHDGEILAEVQYVIENEMCQNSLDILLRRTGIGELGKPKKEILDEVIALAGELLNWSQEQIKEEYKSVEEYYSLTEFYQ